MEKDTVVNRTEYEIGDVGEVQIADDVVAVIAGLAATEVEGVAKMSGNITNEIKFMILNFYFQLSKYSFNF